LKNVYFASDFHLGRDSLHTSAEREVLICQWLQDIKTTAEKIYLVGDLFDYWYEYRRVIPRGNDLFKSTLLQLRREGIPIEIFTGNHDLWMGDYFEQDLDIRVHKNPITVQHHNKSIHIGHGDGLGPGDHGYKFLKSIFSNRLCQWAFSRLHPNFALAFMDFCSKLGDKNQTERDRFVSFDQEWLVQFVETNHKSLNCDYYLYGHRHIPIIYDLSTGNSTYYNIGEWMNQYTYGVLENGELSLKQHIRQDIEIYSNRPNKNRL